MVFLNWWAPLLARPITSAEWLGKSTGGNSLGLQHLPRWLSWFDTFDASTDAGWSDGYFAAAGTYTKASPPSFWLRKWYQVRWLYRNTAYAFAYWPLGIAMQPAAWRVVVYTPTLFIAVSTAGYWNIAYGGRWGSYKLGWKAWNYWRAGTWSTVPWGPAWRTQIVCSINPFQGGGNA
jgi:hypothetical protein